MDINCPTNYGFKQESPTEFYLFDVDGDSLKTGQQLICYSYPELVYIDTVTIAAIEVGIVGFITGFPPTSHAVNESGPMSILPL